MIEADSYYKIRLKRAVKVDNEWLRPGLAKIVVLGSVLETIEDDVLDHEKVE